MQRKIVSVVLACLFGLCTLGCTPVTNTDTDFGAAEVIATDGVNMEDTEPSTEHFVSGTVNEYKGSISADEVKAKALSLLYEQANVNATEDTTCSINAYATGDTYVYDCVVYGGNIDGTAFVAFDMEGNVYAMDANGKTIVEYSDEYTSLLGEDAQYVM